MKRFCFKELARKGTSTRMQIEIDGMAYSASRVLLVERKPRITMDHVEELKYKMQMLR